VFGVGYRVSTDKTHFVPRSRTLQRGSAFLQDEIAIVPGKLLLTVGSKLEKNTFSAWELQPSASLLWNRGDRDTAWVAVSRAAQIPYRSAHDVLNDIFSRPGPQGSVIVGRVFGSADIVADYESALDAGYRIRASRRLSFDLAGFYNHYSGPISKLARAPEFLGGDPPVTLIPLVFTNIPPVETYGAELAASWSPMDAGSLRVSYSWITGETAPDPTIQEPAPRHQLHGRWYWNLPGGLQWDSSYWFIDGHSTIRSYHRVDTRLGWRPNRRWEFSVGGQHLLDNQHLEIPGLLAFPNEVPRSVYGKVTITPF
jgi:iron complex outermembrane receptor protein